MNVEVLVVSGGETHAINFAIAALCSLTIAAFPPDPTGMGFMHKIMLPLLSCSNDPVGHFWPVLTIRAVILAYRKSTTGSIASAGHDAAFGCSNITHSRSFFFSATGSSFSENIRSNMLPINWAKEKSNMLQPSFDLGFVAHKTTTLTIVLLEL